MKRKIGILSLALVMLVSLFAFAACSGEDYYGTYTSTDGRLTLILDEEGATFGSIEGSAKYFVNYGSDRIGINRNEWDCFWNEFEYTFNINEDGTLSLVFEESKDNTIEIIFTT